MATIPAAFLTLLLAQTAGQTPDAAALTAEARRHYNAGRAAEALARLEPVLVRPGEPAAAALVAARSLLERYRVTGEQADLGAARDHLRAIDPSSLTPGERRELIVGLAEALFLEESFGAAAELFDAALGASGADAARPAGPADGIQRAERAERERTLDWWATSLDRYAQLKPQAERRLIYLRIADRMERESREHPASTPAAYWLAAGARGAGELDRAWSAAIAAWLRAPMTLDRGAALRADIDRLVQTALIPERARVLALGPKEIEEARQALQAEWDSLKKNWTR